MKILLHACCAPCAIGFLDGWMPDDNKTPDLLWYNPNIHPFTEHRARRNALADYANDKELNVIMHDYYGLEEFIRLTIDDLKVRCKKCYAMRMNFAAQKAAEMNYDSFSTTLLASPFQKFDLICEAGENAAKTHGVQFIIKDYREGYKGAKQRAREMGIYMQKYCGCIFSEKERYVK
ncbi:MAG: epoxyqueuosine reductase QueH [Defluviitaleaceae bacterium]|nr:epoxyqueuosine reductase QueH [Defluviitaleaceae bacterium]